MVTKVRTIDFLPDIFKTKTNNQFLSATLDQLVQQPDFKRIQGFIGSKFGYGVSSTEKYLVEPTKVRTDYQLEPAVVFKKKDTATAIDAITYPGILDTLKLQNGYVENDNNLFNNEFYSWDSYCDLDKLINFAQYYWLPNGPESLTITTSTVLTNQTYNVGFTPIGYQFTSNDITLEELDPVVTLVRGGTYRFYVNQDSKFWIQSLPGISGVNPNRTNSSTNVINAVVTNVGGLSSVAGDTSPALGGNLSLNSRNIIGTGLINITGNITASNSSISNSILTLTTNSITTTNQVISLGTATSSSVVNIYPSSSNAVNVYGPPGVALEFFAGNGSLASPTTLVTDDGCGGVKFAGRTSGGIYQTVASIFANYKGPAANLTDPDYKGQGILGFTVGDGDTGVVRATLDQYGLFNSPFLATTVYSAAGTAILSAVSMGVGARAFVSDATVATFGTAYTSGGSNKVPVYSDGTIWRIG